jgi:hypothetical protein
VGWVTVTHPATGGTARIAESAVPHYLRAGWAVVQPGTPDPASREAASQPPSPGDGGETGQE